jgi:hypothetical protein
MQFEEITVSCRDEYRGGQEPRWFEWRGDRYPIEQIVDRWYEGSMDSTRFPMRYFRVETPEGKRFILRFHELFRRWSILIPSKEDEEE